ncbi:MAG: PEP-CTERM sorting domain-containing protein [Tepidisphaeraceae bacterium]
MLAANYNLSGPGAEMNSFSGDYALALSIVPEPTTLTAATLGGLLCLRRRRR